MKVEELINVLAKCNGNVDVRVWDGELGVHFDVTGAKCSSYDCASRKPVVELYVNFYGEIFSAPPTPSVTDQRYDQLWSFIGEANKPEELTEFGQGIRAAFEYMCEENAMEDNAKYWEEIKAKTYKKKEYRVRLARTEYCDIFVEATSYDEANGLALEKVLGPDGADDNWYDPGLHENEIVACDEVKNE